jgi:hypothetical protein
VVSPMQCTLAGCVEKMYASLAMILRMGFAVTVKEVNNSIFDDKRKSIYTIKKI